MLRRTRSWLFWDKVVVSCARRGFRARSGRRIQDPIRRFSNISRNYSLGSQRKMTSRKYRRWFGVIFMGTTAAAYYACYKIFYTNSKEQDPSEYKPLSYSEKSKRRDSQWIKKFVLTGGPCGGKSTVIVLIAERLEAMGYNVYVVPEAATILFTGGGRFKDWNTTKEIAFESNKIKTQMALEDAFIELARASGRKAIVLCDRGAMDSAAYVSEDVWSLVLDSQDWSVPQLREKRYDCVIHMVTAANGAEEFYTLKNNATRTESIPEARDLDRRIIENWIGHSRFYIVDNSTDFDGKFQRVFDIICTMMGVPSSTELRKYVVRRTDTTIEDIPELRVQEFVTDTTFLVRGGKDIDKAGYIFVQKRRRDGINTYKYSAKLTTPNNEHMYDEAILSGVEYTTLLEQTDPKRAVVRKRVKYFLWEDRYFEMYEWVHGLQDDALHGYEDILPEGEELVILQTDMTEDEIQQKMPPFLEFVADVTDVPAFSTYKLAKKNRKRKPRKRRLRV